MLGPTTVAPGVARVAARTPTLLPATHTNSYALGTREVLLVEPASPDPDELVEWLAWARGLVSAGRELVGVLATHHHDDHVGGLEVLTRELGLTLFVHAETAARVAHAGPVRTLAEGDQLTLAGPRAMTLRVLHTPGHAPGHLCLLDEAEGTLVVGDMVASEGTILIAPASGGGDMAAYLGQLRRLADLDAVTALPAHGEPIPTPRGLFEKYVTHRLAREARVLRATRAAGDDLDALVRVAYDDAPVALHPIAKLSLEAHLEKLVTDGRVERRGDTFFASGTPVEEAPPPA